MARFKTFNVSLKIETNLSAEEIKASLEEVIDRTGLELENRLEDIVAISSVTVRDDVHQLIDGGE